MGQGMGHDDFAAKLTLALGRANLSRALLAREVGIDKSVVARWAGGQVRPTEHNLLALTHVIARRVPDLTLDDWRLPKAAFAARLGRPAETAETPSGLLAQVHGWTRDSLDRSLATYGGLWLLLYDNVRVKRVFGMVAEIRSADGALEVEIRDHGNFHARGPAFAMQGKLWVVGQEIERRDSLAFGIYWGATRGRAEILDGLAMVREFAPSAAPGATHVSWYRLGDLLPGDDGLARMDAAVARIGALNEAGWEDVLPPELIERMRGSVTCLGTTLRLAVETSLAINDFDLRATEDAAGQRRAALTQLRALFADAMVSA